MGMTELLMTPKTIAAVLLILLSIGTDLRTQKVPNWLILFGFALALVLIAIFDGKSGIWPTLGSILAATLFAFPLYSMRAIGAGDVKLLWILSLLVSWNIIVTTILASMLWGACLGIFREILAGRGRAFFKNVLLVLQYKGPERNKLASIPYTVAIFFGLMTSLSMMTAGISWV